MGTENDALASREGYSVTAPVAKLLRVIARASR